MRNPELLKISIEASVKAGLEILKIYNTNFDIEYKSDNSPLTQADKAAHEIIISFLNKTNIPVLSEEGKHLPYETRKKWGRLWIVDPLDGTKEFIKKNGEFTVNIALVEDSKPILGVIYAPVLDKLYYGENNIGSFMVDKASLIIENNYNYENAALKLPLDNPIDYYGVVASRSHLSDSTSEFINGLKAKHKNIKIVSKGSSLKLCLIAEGSAHIYPRFAPTMEWDTAAGHAIVSCAGGKVHLAHSANKELKYNKPDLLNPWFVAAK